SEHKFEYSPERDGGRVKLGAGLLFSAGALITGQSSIGWQRLTVRTPLVPSFSGLVGGVDLAIPVGTGTRFGVRAGRDVYFSGGETSVYYVQNSLGASVTQPLGERWDIGARVERAALDYAQLVTDLTAAADRERDDLLGGSVGYRI